jgi:large conductance mechanosensitive channel
MKRGFFVKENKAVQKTTGFFKEFKDFISRGNVIDLAVGVIIGGAFSGIVNNLVTNIVTPAISLLTGKVSFTDLFIALDGGEYATLAAAQEAGAATLNYGNFISAILNFLIMAFVVFLLVKGINTFA